MAICITHLLQPQLLLPGPELVVRARVLDHAVHQPQDRVAHGLGHGVRDVLYQLPRRYLKMREETSFNPRETPVNVGTKFREETIKTVRYSCNTNLFVLRLS